MAATVPMKFMIDEELAKAIRIAAAEIGGKGQLSIMANAAFADYLRKEIGHVPPRRNPTGQADTRE